MIPLVLWIGFSLAALPVDHATLTGWIQQTWVTIVLILLIIVTFYHAQLGLQVIIEDYVATHARRTAMLLASNLACLLVGTIAMVYAPKEIFSTETTPMVPTSKHARFETSNTAVRRACDAT